MKGPLYTLTVRDFLFSRPCNSKLYKKKKHTQKERITQIRDNNNNDNTVKLLFFSQIFQDCQTSKLSLLALSKV